MTKRGFTVLALRNIRLSREEWCRLIEARVDFIKPHLDSFTLSTLGRLECLGPSSVFRHSLEVDAPVIINDGSILVALETQGIFACPEPGVEYSGDLSRGYFSSAGGVSCPGGKKHIWGFTRGGRWILATVTFRGTQGQDYRGYERAEEVHTQEATIPFILSITRSRPKEMWHTLGQAVIRWEQDRAKRYVEAQQVAQGVREQDFALSLVPE